LAITFDSYIIGAPPKTNLCNSVILRFCHNVKNNYILHVQKKVVITVMARW